MFKRDDKESENIVKMAVVLVYKKELLLARQIMSEGGISHKVMERILYEPLNTRKSDLIAS